MPTGAGSRPAANIDALISERAGRVLDLLEHAGEPSFAGVVWRSPLDSRVTSVFGAAGGPERDVQATWLDAAIDLPAEDAHAVAGGVMIAPVMTTDGRRPAVLVAGVPSGGSAAALGRAFPSAVTLLSQLFDDVDERGRRAHAYQALFEIGTQIQAEEVHADTIFELIVERARSLLATDVSWLALVEDDGNVQIRVATGATTPEFMEMHVDLGTGIGGQALIQGRTIAVRDAGLYANQMPDSIRTALEHEGVRSVLCSPMLRDGTMVGALYVGVREPVDFTPESVSLLSALAAQTAVAIDNSRLYQALAEKNTTLQSTFAIHRLLTDASLAGDGLDEILNRLGELIDRDLILAVESGAPRVVRCGREGHGADLMHLTIEQAAQLAGDATVAIRAGDAELGHLFAIGGNQLTPLHRNALEHGGTVIALELVKEQAATETEWRLQGDLLEELLRAGGPTSESLTRRAGAAGIDLDIDRRVALLLPQSGATGLRLLEVVQRTLRSRGASDALVARRSDDMVIVAIEDRPDAEDLLRQVQLLAKLGGAPCAIGLSRAHTDLPAALREATAALTLSGRQQDGFINYEALGPLRFLTDAPDTDEIARVVHDLLGPLSGHDRERHSQLLPTLEVFLRTGGHQPSTCAECHIHVSTLKYRLSRISAIIGRSLADPSTRFQLSLAFELRSILRLLGQDPLSDRD